MSPGINIWNLKSSLSIIIIIFINLHTSNSLNLTQEINLITTTTTSTTTVTPTTSIATEITSSGSTVETDNNNKFYGESLRLPNNSIPLAYNLSFVINVNETLIDGLANIEILIQNTTKQIVLHAKNLNNFKIHLINLQTGDDISNLTYSYNNYTNFLKIYTQNYEYEFTEHLKYMLIIKYQALIQLHNPEGIYKSQEDQYHQNIITTQFEPSFARQAFPCFDEPKFKARFLLTLTHSSQYSALSNMPIIDEPSNTITSNNDELQTITTTRFQQTPLMSSYLLAFTLHNYLNVTANINNITQSVYYLNVTDQARANYTVQKTSEIIEKLEELLGFQYKLPKLDQIGVPTTYGSAMENWGLITYEGNKFLLNEYCRTEKDFRRIITIVHEIVHQWFGNLVSPKWWTYTWLNEGFATYYSYIIADLVFPECNVNNQRVVDSLDVAFAWPSNRPLSNYVEKESHVKMGFDAISYHRAGFIIWMIQHSLGMETFQKGIHNYIEKFQYSVADENDLFDCLERSAINDNIKYFNEFGDFHKFAKSWTQNNGFPNLKVTRNYENGEITFQQTPNSKFDNLQWYIPITMATPVNSNFQSTQTDYMLTPTLHVNTTINPRDLNITLNSNDWLILNKKQTGLYHINYDNTNWLLIAKALHKNHLDIDVINRAQIIRDITAFMKPGSVDISTVLEIFAYLKYETEQLPWDEASFIIYEMDKRIEGTRTSELFQYFIRDIIEPIYKKLKYLPKHQDLPLTDILRSSIYQLACQVNLEDCLKYSYEQLQNYMHTNNYEQSFLNNHYDLCGGINYVTNDEFILILNQLLLLYNDNNNTDIFHKLLTPLICTKNVTNILYLLNSIFELSNNTADQDFEIFYKITFDLYSTNIVAQPLIIDIYIKYFDILSENFELLFENLEVLTMYIPQNPDLTNNQYQLLMEKINSNQYGEKFQIDPSHIGMLPLLRKQFIIKNEENLNQWLLDYKLEQETQINCSTLE